MVRMAWDTGPIPSLIRAMEEAKTKGWFEAVILSAANLEHYGYVELKKQLDSVDIEYGEERLKRLQFIGIALLLYTTGKIEHRDYDTMCKVNSVRNKVMHRRKKRKTLYGKEADEEIKPLIEDSIRILKKLHAVRLRAGRS